MVEVEDAMFFLSDAAHPTLRVYTRAPLAPTQRERLYAWASDEDGVVAQIFNTSEAIIAQDVADHLGLPQSLGVEKAVLVPLVAREQVLGVLAVVNPRDGGFAPDDIKALHTIADQVAVSIQNARLVAAERRRADMMALINQVGQQVAGRLDMDGLMREIVEGIHTVLGYSVVYLHIYKEDTHEFVVQASAAGRPSDLVEIGYRFSADRGVSGRALRTQQTQLVPDVAQDPDYFSPSPPTPYRSCLTVPLRLDGRVLGVLDILSSQYDAFDATDRDAIETLAGHVTIIIDNSARYTREQTRRMRAERLQAAAQVISRQLQLHALMNVITKEAAGIFDLPSASISTFDEDTQTLYPNNGYGISADYLRQRQVDVTTLPGWQELRSGQPVYYADLSATAGEQAGLVRQEGLVSMLSIPLLKGSQYLGNLNLYTRDRPRIFDTDELELAQLLAGQVAIALENVRLFEALEVHAQELAQANRLKSEFLANISHELRTPMNAIIGFSEAMFNGFYGDISEKQADRLGTVLRNARHLLSLIEDLLDISKIGAGRLRLTYEMVSIRSEVENIAAQHQAEAEAAGLELRVQLADKLPLVRGDVMRVRQVLDNLVSNAIKFTHQGSVTITADTRLRDGRNWIWCAVQDTGIGISRQHQAIVFDEFRQVDGSTTREYGGTGLGLAIAKKLIEMMGGRIWIESAGVPGEGSTFTFELPVMD